MTNFTPEIQKYDKNTSHIRRRQAIEGYDLSEKDASTKIISYICISLNPIHYGS